MANVLNYTEQGGDKTVIGGDLLITGKITAESGAQVEGFVTAAANQAASEATTIAGLKDDLNDLLSKLKTAGLMTADTVGDD